MTARLVKFVRMLLFGAWMTVFVVAYWTILYAADIVVEFELFLVMFGGSPVVVTIAIIFSEFSNRLVQPYPVEMRKFMGTLAGMLFIAGTLTGIVFLVEQNYVNITETFVSIMILLLVPGFVITTMFQLSDGGSRWPFKKAVERHEINSKAKTDESRELVFESGIKTLTPELACVVTQLFERAQSMMNRATVVLLIIISVLVVTGVFIVFAGKIAGIGASGVDLMADMKRDRDAIEEEIKELEREIEFEESERLSQKAPDESREEYVTDRAVSSVGIPVVSASVARGLRHARLTDELRKVNTEIRSSRETLLNSGVGEGMNGAGMLESIADPKLLLAAGLTRLGVLVVAIYLVQILVNLYRYNTRVATYYLASADSILVGGKDASSVKTLIEVLYPKVGFGKMPTTMWEKAMESLGQGEKRGADEEKTGREQQEHRERDSKE